MAVAIGNFVSQSAAPVSCEILLDRLGTRRSICGDAEVADAAYDWLASCARERCAGTHYSRDHACIVDRLLHKSRRIFGAESTSRLQAYAWLILCYRSLNHGWRAHSGNLFDSFLSTRTPKLAEPSQLAFYGSGLGI